MPSSPRANAKQTAMPCSDLDGVDTDTTMLTTLFDPTEWPPLLNLMDSTSTMSAELINKEKMDAKRKRVTETEAEDGEKKRTKLETVGEGEGSEDEMCSAEVKESPEVKERRLLEERKNVLRVSVCKMRMIEDPEMFLRRSVLIHNTIRRLQVDMGQENFMKFTQNFVSEGTEINVENDRTSCLVGFLEYQEQNSKESHEMSAKDFQNDLTDYSDYHDNSDEDSDDEDEDEDDDDDLCVSKDYHDDRLGTKAQHHDMNSSTCMCYHDSWCRQDCVRGCSARRESNQCATEYRTTRNSNQGESVFDSVVYHSLLVSLES